MLIDELRQKIDVVDEHIWQLLQLRMETVCDIAQEKAKLGLPILNDARERQVLKNLENSVDSKFYPYCEKIYVEVMEQCKAVEKEVKE